MSKGVLAVAIVGGSLLVGCAGSDVDSATSSSGGTESAEPQRYRVTLENVSAPGLLAGEDVLFAAGVWATHESGFKLFTPGEPAAPALEQLAEDGAFEPLLNSVEDGGEALSAGFYGASELGVSYDDMPLSPGTEASFVVTAPPGAHLSFAGMWIQSNDTFYGSVAGGIPLDTTGDITTGVTLWDAGTEVNQEPGAGPDQAPRQADANTGADEGGTVAEIDGRDRAGFEYPSIGSTLRVTLAVEAGP